MEHQEYEKLKISPFDAEKGKKRKSSSQHQKALITSYFLNIKGSLLFPILLPPRCSDMSCQSLYYAQVLSFLLWIPDRVGHLIWRLWGFWCPSIFLDFVTSGTFLPPHSFMSLPALKVSCLFSTMTICGSKKKKGKKKKYLLKRLLSKSVQAWSLSKSKAWAEAYNGLESLEEAAFFFTLFLRSPSSLWYLWTHSFMTRS